MRQSIHPLSIDITSLETDVTRRIPEGQPDGQPENTCLRRLSLATEAQKANCVTRFVRINSEVSEVLVGLL